MKTVVQTNFPDVELFRRGKARDVYKIGDKLLIITTDRISAFDVIMDDAIPQKGVILNQTSKFWFGKTQGIIKNHFITDNIDEYPEILHKYREELEGRSMLVKSVKALPVECVARGYLAGSGWKEYNKSGTVCGISLPAGLEQYSRLPEPIYTPATKADVGHDENIDFESSVKILGNEVAEKLKEYTLALYNFVWNYLNERGALLADTKFEFGIDENGEIILIDEICTPDSSRIWLKETYAPGKAQENFDKQVLRDYLETLDWDKNPPPPPLPQEIIEKTVEKYNLALNLLHK